MRFQDTHPFGDTLMREHRARNQGPCSVIDIAFHDRRAAGNDGRIDVVVARARPRAEMLCSVAHFLTDLQYDGLMNSRDNCVLRGLVDYWVVGQPVLYVPAILEEGPNHVLEIDVGYASVIVAVDWLFNSFEESARAIKLVAITIMASPGLDVPHHNRGTSQPRHATPFGNDSATG
jgi:hypothetical protein